MTPRQLEDNLRAEGYSRKAAVALVAAARQRGETKEPGQLRQWTEKIRRVVRSVGY